MENAWKSFRLGLRVTQFILVALTLVTAYYHAFPTSVHSDRTDFPVIDAVTLGCLGIIVIAIMLPAISEVTLGGTSVKLRRVEKSANRVSETLDDVANLAQNWSTSVGTLADALDSNAGAERDRLITQYYRDRMGEAQNFLTDDPDDVARVALWMPDDSTGTVDYVWSNDFKPTKLSWRVGEGMIGKCFEEGRSFNEPDVRVLPSYVSTRPGQPPYRAVLVQPVFLGMKKLGVITVDKREAEIFDRLATEVTKGLAAQCAIAYYLWRRG